MREWAFDGGNARASVDSFQRLRRGTEEDEVEWNSKNSKKETLFWLLLVRVFSRKRDSGGTKEGGVEEKE